MKPSNRDLLVLVKDEHLNEKAIENELEQLNQLLFHVETIDNFCSAHEVLDMNRYRILQEARQIRKLANQKELAPFVFIFNKN